ncbi:hypothetical protein BLNAU_15735 [Blattamonas nauphoetae]|uniref:Uncharacterized protein n=1 Tax=Blattamonas nauphoetae TaxID=2049346 RepID=A0ABQ9XDC9_9EUKA|nr:hypothetical protein BLNAU_15735 [Blattamonas nauphoetae]
MFPRNSIHVDVIGNDSVENHPDSNCITKRLLLSLPVQAFQHSPTSSSAKSNPDTLHHSNHYLLSPFQDDARLICSLDAAGVNGMTRMTKVEFGPTRDIALVIPHISTT